MSKKLIINIALTFVYFFTSGVMVAGTDKLGASALLAVAAAAVRATIGALAKIPVDQ